MKYMSFSKTKEAILNKTKTVTRRMGWYDLKAGDIIQPVEKAMGLKKGEHIKLLGCPIKIISIRRERIKDITQEDVIKEGFENFSTKDFIDLFCLVFKRQLKNFISPSNAWVNRIEFEYVDKEERQ